VLELRQNQIRPAPQFNTAVDASFITGVGTVVESERERMLILVNIEQLMSSSDMGLFDSLG
jgi:purine-binding chemotaxis protein CheW